MRAIMWINFLILWISQMVPISEAIETGAWLKAECPNDGAWPGSDYKALNNGNPVTLRFRVTGFSRIDLAAIDQPGNLQCRVDSNVWQLNIEVVNLCIREVYSSLLGKRLVIVDQDGFEFVWLDDVHLCFLSKYAEKSALKSGSLPPKIKRTQAFAYELPEDYDQLLLKIRKGSLTEV